MKKILSFMLIGTLLILFMVGCGQTAQEPKQETAQSTPQQTEVYLIGAIHHQHETNPNFSEEVLLNYIHNIDPDIIALDILEEHMTLSTEELYERYSSDCSEVKREFEVDTKIIPFAWYPQLQREDPEVYAEKKSQMWADMMKDPYKQREKEIIKDMLGSLQTVIAYGTPQDINSYAFDELARLKGALTISVLEGTEHEAYIEVAGDINEEKNSNMRNNLKKIIEENSGKKIVIVVGAMHRNHLVPFIKENFPDVKFESAMM